MPWQLANDSQCIFDSCLFADDTVSGGTDSRQIYIYTLWQQIQILHFITKNLKKVIGFFLNELTAVMYNSYNAYFIIKQNSNYLGTSCWNKVFMIVLNFSWIMWLVG